MYSSQWTHSCWVSGVCVDHMLAWSVFLVVIFVFLQYVCRLGGGWHVYHSMHVEVTDELRNLFFLPSSASALPDEPVHQPWYLLRHGLLLNLSINKPCSLARELQGSTCLCPPTPVPESQVYATMLSFCGHYGSELWASRLCSE